MRRIQKPYKTLKGDETLSETMELRQKKFLNNIIEQDHRAIKRRAFAGMGNKSVQHGSTNIERMFEKVVGQ